jgi:anthranilate/para-aminobenzoate synthase component II
MNTNPFAWSPGPTESRPAEALIRRAQNEIAVFGYMCLDTAALLMEHGVDVPALEDGLTAS